MRNEQTEPVRLNKERLNGLRLRTLRHKPKTSVADFLDHTLEKAGIPRMTDQEYNEKVKQIEVTA